MSFLEKKNKCVLFLLTAILFVCDVNSGQKVGALTLARERERAANVNRRKIYDTKRTIRKGSLENQQKMQAKNYGVDTVSLAEVQEQVEPDRFTQTEAHLQVKEVRDLLGADPNYQIISHLDTLSDCLSKEKELQKTHYAFYHTTENAWRVTQDLYTQLNAYFNPSESGEKEEFAFLRYGKYESQPTAKEFLVQELRRDGLIDDNGKLAAILLSVNLSLFGNIGFESECSWQYFLREHKHRMPMREDYEKIMQEFGLPYNYIDELLALPNLFDTKEKTILQVFIPKSQVDQVGYLAWATGIPAHEDTINWVKATVKSKPKQWINDRPVALIVLEDLRNKFKAEQEKNPLFKDLITSVQENDYSVDSFLKIYCNRPWELPNINNAQVRLILSPEVLLNPNSGVMVYRYTTASHTGLEEYSEKLKKIVNDLINGKQASLVAEE